MKKLVLAFVPVMLLIAACGGQQEAGESGRARVMVTDAPASEAETLPVTFSGIQLIEAEGGGSVSVAIEPQTIDVLTLRNGGLETLGEVELPPGTYSQVRLIVDEARITFEGDVSHEVKVPSGAQTGLKINIEPALVVEADQTSEVVLDFDAERGVVENPPGGDQYILIPSAIRAVSAEATGTVEGTVVVPGLEALPLEGVTITVYDQEGNEITATVTEADGSFRFITLPEGTYDFSLDLEGYASVTIEDVEVVAGEVTATGELELSAEVAVGGTAE